MRLAILVNLGNDFFISADTQGELYYPDDVTFQKPIVRLYSDERLFFSALHKIAIISFGPIAIANIFVKKILQEFIDELNQHSNQLDMDIQAAKKLFITFVESGYPNLREQLFQSLHLIFVKQQSNLLSASRLRFEKKDSKYQEIQPSIIQFAPQEMGKFGLNKVTSSIFHISGVASDKIEQAGPDAVRKHIIEQFKEKKLAVGLLHLSSIGKIKERAGEHVPHPFGYLDDFVVSVQKGYFACTMADSYRLKDLHQLIPKHSNHHLLHQDDRFINFEQFIKICRNRGCSDNKDFFIFYMNVYQLFNSATKHDALFRHKLKFILKQNVLFLIELSTDVNNTTLALYAMESRCITFYGNELKHNSLARRSETFRHEVEHAYKSRLHETRWLTQNISMKNITTHAFPFFPYYEQEMKNWDLLIEKGISKIKKTLTLLDAGTLDKNEEDLLTKYKLAVEHYRPKVIEIYMILSENDPLFNPELQKSINEFSKVISRNWTIFGIQVSLYLTNITLHSGKKFRVDGYTTMEKNLKTAIYDLLFTFNKDFLMTPTDPIHRSERHAYLISETQHSLLALFFPEVLEYDYHDALASLGEPVTEYYEFLPWLNKASSPEVKSMNPKQELPLGENLPKDKTVTKNHLEKATRMLLSSKKINPQSDAEGQTEYQIKKFVTALEHDPISQKNELVIVRDQKEPHKIQIILPNLSFENKEIAETFKTKCLKILSDQKLAEDYQLTDFSYRIDSQKNEPKSAADFEQKEKILFSETNLFFNQPKAWQKKVPAQGPFANETIYSMTVESKETDQAKKFSSWLFKKGLNVLVSKVPNSEKIEVTVDMTCSRHQFQYS